MVIRFCAGTDINTVQISLCNFMCCANLCVVALYQVWKRDQPLYKNLLITGPHVCFFFVFFEIAKSVWNISLCNTRSCMNPDGFVHVFLIKRFWRTHVSDMWHGRIVSVNECHIKMPGENLWLSASCWRTFPYLLYYLRLSTTFKISTLTYDQLSVLLWLIFTV